MIAAESKRPSYPLLLLLLPLILSASPSATSTAASSSCPLDYSDMASRTTASKVVIDAIALQKGQVEILKNTQGVLFVVKTYLKGGVRKTLSKNESLISLSSDQGCLEDVKLEQRYILFLTGNKHDFEFLVSKRLYIPNGKPVVYESGLLEQIAQFSCPTCGKKPKAKLKISSPTNVIRPGQLVEMVCTMTGSPNPKASWFRGTTQLENNDEITITDDGLTSQLAIKAHSTYWFIDSYQCKATNVLGESETDRVYLQGDPKDPTSKEPAFFKLCEDQRYCNGHGLCEEIISTGYKRCNCSAGFEGKRCQMSLVTMFPLVKSGEFSLTRYISVILFFLILLALLAVLVFLFKFRSDILRKIKTVEESRWTEATITKNDEESPLRQNRTTPSNQDQLDGEHSTLINHSNNNHIKFKDDTDNAKGLGKITSLRPQQRFPVVTFDDAPTNMESPPYSPAHPSPPFIINQSTRKPGGLRLPIGNDFQPGSAHNTIASKQPDYPGINRVNRSDQYASNGYQPPPMSVKRVDDTDSLNREIRLNKEAEAIVNEMMNYNATSSKRTSPLNGTIRS